MRRYYYVNGYHLAVVNKVTSVLVSNVHIVEVNKMAYIGVVVPVYKIKQEYFEQCVESLRNQTFQDIQIILVDDCSPDNCGFLCDEYARKDSRITVVHHEKNKGLPSARNSGIEALDSDWVTFVDGDDWVDLDMCEKLADFLQNNKQPDMIIFSGYRNYHDLEERSQAAFENNTWFDSYEKICALQRRSLSFIRKGYAPQALTIDSACWKLISSRFIREKGIRFIDVPYREDGLFFLYSTEEASSIVYLYLTFYHYRSTGNSMVNMYRKNADLEHLRYLQEVLIFVDKFQKDDPWIKDYYYSVLVSMQICITSKFFNKENPEPFRRRQSACRQLFDVEPFKSAFMMTDLRTLRINHFVKTLCIKFRWYAGVTLLRNLYLKMNRRKQYN